MTPLTPELALAYLQALTAELRAAAVLGSDGTLMAGDATLGARAAAALRDAPPGAAMRLPGGPGGVHVARSATHGVAVVVGPRALGALVARDLTAALEGLRSS